MSLTKLDADLAVIAKLPDTPTETSYALKAKFDQGSLAIGEYLNKRLVPELDNSLSKLESKTEKIPAVVDALDSAETEAALSAAQGKVLNESKQNRILSGTSAPSGGSDGDLYIWY